MSQKLRTLLRITNITPTEVFIPAWSQETVELPVDLIKDLSKVEMHYRFYAKVNLEAKTPEELDISDIENVD